MTVPQGKQTVTDDEIIETMASHQDPAFTTAELASMFNMSAEGIRGRLKDLVESGDVDNKKPTSRTVIWWVYCDSSEDELSK